MKTTSSASGRATPSQRVLTRSLVMRRVFLPTLDVVKVPTSRTALRQTMPREELYLVAI